MRTERGRILGKNGPRAHETPGSRADARWLGVPRRAPWISREGVDYEKIRILRRQNAESSDRDVKQLMDTLERSLDAVARAPTLDDAQVRELLRDARKTLNDLSEREIRPRD